MNWQLLLPAFLGFVGGAIASVVTPLVKWKIEEVRLRTENRRNKIKEWRDVFTKAESVKDIMYTPAFIYFRKRLEDININIGDFLNTRVFIIGGGDGEKDKLRTLLELVDEIEKEWRLL